MNQKIYPVLSLLLFCCITSMYAQNSSQQFTGAQATAFYKGASLVTVSQARNTIAFVRLQDKEIISEANAKSWLKNDLLKARTEDDLVQYQQFGDKIGMDHLRYRQQYKGVPVEYGVYYVHSKADRIQSANGEWYQGINISVTPSISPSEAYTAACNYMNAKKWWHETEEKDNNRLMILPDNGTYTLVYKCDVYSLEPRRREWIYVDAQNGAIVKTESRIHETDVPGTAVTAYSGIQPIVSDSFQLNKFRLREYTRGAGIETYNVSEPNDFTGPSKDWNYNGGFDMYALDAHFGCEATYDYYNDNYGWKSVDGAGAQKLKSLVHTGSGINAFWDGTYMSYLDGDASNGNLPLTSLEVCGHELTHGVTEHSSGLIYSCESGSINESMSDIFGVTIRFLNIPNGTWYLGDQFNYILRNMANPNDYSNPDTYGGTYWSSCPEVHSGSGVGNFWYYLLTEGGSGTNDVGNAYVVEGIGLVDAGAIAFRTNTVYLTPNSPYSDLYQYSVQSSLDLFGDCTPQTINTANAGYAVNIGGVFAGGVNALFSVDQSSFCGIPATVNFTSLSTNATDYQWDFGDGSTSTDVNPSHTYTTVGDFTVTLIVNGFSLCNLTDTTVKENFIHTQNIGQPVAPSCIPTTVLAGPKYGIFNFKLEDIDQASSNATEGYKDFSCSAFTGLLPGETYTATIKLSTKGDDARMWIDYSADGIFTADELIYSVDDATGDVSAVFVAPANPLLNTPLRLRIIEENKSFDITDACYNPERGQCEDYMVYFVNPAVCDAPIGLNSDDITASSAHLSWNAVNGAVKYKVRYKIVGSNPWITVTSATNSKHLEGLLANTDYKWKVKTVCSLNPKFTSDYSAFELFTTTGQRLESSAANTSLEIYPNPFESSSVISYTLDADAIVSIELWNTLGQKIGDIKSSSPQSAGSYTYELSASETGMYFIRLSVNNSVTWNKVVKVK